MPLLRSRISPIRDVHPPGLGMKPVAVLLHHFMVGYVRISYWLLAIGHSPAIPHPCETALPGCIQRSVSAGLSIVRYAAPPRSRRQMKVFLLAAIRLLLQGYDIDQVLPTQTP